MNTSIALLLVVLGVMVVGGLGCGLLDLRHSRRIRAQNARDTAERARRQEWATRVDIGRPLLTGSTWRDPRGKGAFIEFVCRAGQPTLLLYELAEGKSELSPEELLLIGATFWPQEGYSPPHVKVIVPDHPEIGRALRIEHPQRVVEAIVLSGMRCPLYQMGDMNKYGRATDGPSVFFPHFFTQEAHS